MKNKTLKKKNKVINLYSFWHLGDAIFVMIYLYNCKEYILKNNITVNFYIRENHVKQVKEFECCKNIHVHPIIFLDKCKYKKLFKDKLKFINDLLLDLNLCDTNIPKNSINTFHGIDCVLNHLFFKLNMFKEDDDKTPLNKYLCKYFSDILGKQIGFPKINKFVYSDTDLLKRYNSLPSKYQNIDVLVINSEPQSQQYDLEKNRKDFEKMVNSLNNKYKIVTTEKIKDIPSTRDGNLSLKDIGAISTHAKYIIFINSGPITPCLNSYALKHVKKWFEFDIRLPINYGKNFYINKSFDEIIKEIG